MLINDNMCENSSTLDYKKVSLDCVLIGKTWKDYSNIIPKSIGAYAKCIF